MKNYRLKLALDCSAPDRVPYVPAIYEHKAWFVNDTPSNVSRSVELFTKAVLAEYELIQPDALTIGIDVYNVEAEALGCDVIYYEDNDSSVPAISADSAVITERDDPSSMKIPDPYKSGRMPVNVEVGRNVVKRIDGEVPVRGAISGPFSLAANLVGPERLFVLTLTNPEFVRKLLRFAASVGERFGEAYIETGCEIVIFDSQASPELLPPKMYRELILGPTKSMITHFHELGVRHVPLIIGGDTTKILDSYLETGANNILCDFPADTGKFISECSKVSRAFRKNIDSADFLVASPSEIFARSTAGLEESARYPGYILGTAVVPYGTKTENIAAVREAVIEFSKHMTGKNND